MFEAFEWVQKCIYSCDGPWQLKTAMNLIRSFEKQFGREPAKKYVDILMDDILEMQKELAVS